MKSGIRKLLFLLLLVPFAVSAQDSTSGYLELTSDEKISGIVEVKSELFKQKYILLNDSVKYQLNQVKAFQNKDGFFVVFRNSRAVYKIAKRKETGNIDLYTSYELVYSAGTYSPGFGPGGAGGGVSNAAIEYYRKNNGALKSIEYDNLKTNLADNTKSMEYLRSYKSLNYAKIGLGVLGAGIIVSAFAGMSKEEGLPKGPLISGAVVMNLLWIPQILQGQEIKDAIKAYNE